MKTTSTPRTQEAPSCFEAALRAFLRRSHPELLSDNDFILRRSEDAAATFSRGRRDGHSVYEAIELSRAVLYDGLRFSRYDTLFEVVSEWFPEIAPRRRPDFCLKLLPLCTQVFERYAPGDDFESTPAYRVLTTELIGIVQQNLDRYGF